MIITAYRTDLRPNQVTIKAHIASECNKLYQNLGLQHIQEILKLDTKYSIWTVAMITKYVSAVIGSIQLKSSVDEGKVVVV